MVNSVVIHTTSAVTPIEGSLVQRRTPWDSAKGSLSYVVFSTRP